MPRRKKSQTNNLVEELNSLKQELKELKEKRESNTEDLYNFKNKNPSNDQQINKKTDPFDKLISKHVV